MVHTSQGDENERSGIVWKTLSQLREEGRIIYAVHNQDIDQCMVLSTWDEVKKHTAGVKNFRYKLFETEPEAHHWLFYPDIPFPLKYISEGTPTENR